MSGVPSRLFLKRYDSKRFRGWGSVSDMIPWDLWGKVGCKDIGGVSRGTAGRASPGTETASLEQSNSSHDAAYASRKTDI